MNRPGTHHNSTRGSTPVSGSSRSPQSFNGSPAPFRHSEPPGSHHPRFAGRSSRRTPPDHRLRLSSITQALPTRKPSGMLHLASILVQMRIRAEETLRNNVVDGDHCFDPSIGKEEGSTAIREGKQQRHVSHTKVHQRRVGVLPSGVEEDTSAVR